MTYRKYGVPVDRFDPVFHFCVPERSSEHFSSVRNSPTLDISLAHDAEGSGKIS